MVLQHIAESILYCVISHSFIVERPEIWVYKTKTDRDERGLNDGGLQLFRTTGNETTKRIEHSMKVTSTTSTMLDSTARRQCLFIANPKSEKFVLDSVISHFWRRLRMIICTARHTCGRSFEGNASHTSSRRCVNECARAFRHTSSRGSEELFIRAACLSFLCSEIADHCKVNAPYNVDYHFYGSASSFSSIRRSFLLTLSMRWQCKNRMFLPETWRHRWCQSVI